MEDIYTNMEVYPHHDLIWESLTGREHLLFYGRLMNLKADGLKSGGVKRRLIVAISLIGDPKAVYMDKPSTGLEPASRNNLWDVMRLPKQDRAIILTNCVEPLGIFFMEAWSA